MTTISNLFITHEDVDTVAQSIMRRSENHTQHQDSSLYTYPDGSHCLVGAIAEGLGLPLPNVGSMKNDSNVTGLVSFWHSHGIFLDFGVAPKLQRLQNLADSNCNWSTAIEFVI